MENKIAICFSGHLRYVEEGIKYWKDIIEKYNIDVYGSFWNISDDIEKKIDEELDIIKSEKIYSLDKIENLKNENEYYKYLFVKELKPIKFEFEDYELFKKSTIETFLYELEPPFDLVSQQAENVKIGKFIAMYYKIWRSNLLSKSKKYDIVIRARIDTYLDNIIIEKNSYINLPEGEIGIWNWKNCNGPMDIFAYGNPENMDYYSSLYLYLARYLKEGHYMHPTENILKVHLAQRIFEINQLKSKIFLFRSEYPFIGHMINTTKYLSNVDISVDPSLTFYKFDHFNFDFTYSYEKDVNKFHLIIDKEITVKILLWNNSNNILLYASDYCFFTKSYSKFWYSPFTNLYDIDNIRIELINQSGEIIKEKIIKLNE